MRNAPRPSRQLAVLPAFITVLAAGLQLAATAQQGGRQFGPGECGPADPAYIRTATDTGGQPFFLSPAEVAQSGALMSASFLHSELLVWAHGDREKTFTVPIDPSIERAAFSASFDGTGGRLTVTSPDGTVVQQGEGVQETRLNCVRSLSVVRPRSGTWQATVTPTARFWFVARSKSELSLMTAEFVRPGGRPGHEGLFKSEGQPLAGRPATLRARLSDEVTSAEFGLMSLNGDLLGRLKLARVDADEFVGDIQLPDEPFRVFVSGLTPTQAPYRRVHSQVFRPETFEVVPPAFDTLTAGAETRVPFVVRNFGPPVRLNLVAIDDRGGVLPVNPASLELAQGAEGKVAVRVRPPAGAVAESRVVITLTASREQPELSWNSASKAFTVTTP